MINFTELEHRVYAWAETKGILKKGTPLKQHSKTEEECFELLEALEAQSRGEDTYINSKGKLCMTDYEILDGLGDALVTLVIQCKMQGVLPLEALKSALEVIEKREGEMVDGVFVKKE